MKLPKHYEELGMSVRPNPNIADWWILTTPAQQIEGTGESELANLCHQLAMERYSAMIEGMHKARELVMQERAA